MHDTACPVGVKLNGRAAGGRPRPGTGKGGRVNETTPLGDGLHDAIEAEREFMPLDVYEIKAMLSYEERLYCHHAARTAMPGAIVELGAFLGGSTLALASGAEHRDATVDSFDQFRLVSEREKEWFPDGFDARPGDSTRRIYEHNIRRVRDRVTVHEGDVCEATWDRPIALLFVDVAKSWTTADAVWNTFFPWLRPGALVIQQDLVHWGHPWCPIIMEHLADHFEYVGWTWLASSVWRCVTPPDNIPSAMLDAFNCDEMLALVDRAADRVGYPAAGSIRLSGVRCLVDFGRLDEARRRLAGIRAGLGDEQLPSISEGYRAYDKRIARAEAGPDAGG